MTPPKALRKYLASHAEPEAQLASAFPDKLGDVVVIPSCGEGESLCATLDSVPQSRRGAVAIIVVLNARADAPKSVQLANQRTRESLRDRYGSGRGASAPAELLEHRHGPLLLIDRATAGREFPARQGVGLARKLGGDVALKLSTEGRLRSPWIHCTDADVLLPEDYFERTAESDVEAESSETALLFPFRHLGLQGSQTQPASAAALEYEASLRYYVLGLRYAGSPYAFHSIGSTIAIRALAYAQVRGFPRREAGEDFYVLNKLRKLGRIRALEGKAILLSDRHSDRVPFGTGAALRAAMQSGNSRLTYPPLLFACLRAWLAALEQLARDPSCDVEALASADLGSDANAELLLQQLRARNLLARARQAAASNDESQRRDRIRTFFDAFETLKLLHALRNAACPPIELRQALAQAPFLSLRGDESLSDICEVLAAAERRPLP